MITCTEALDTVLSCTPQSSIDMVDISECTGKILRRPILAFRNEPPIHRALKDGIALNSNAIAKDLKQFKIEGVARAGDIQKRLIDENNCLEVMTGAPLPIGCDSVIMYEDLRIEHGYAKIVLGHPGLIPLENIAKEGSHHFKGEVLLDVGTLIRPHHVGILASQGHKIVHVSKMPKVSIITSGDEVIGIECFPELHQIRSSNQYALQSMLQTLGIKNIRHIHLADNLEESINKISTELEESDYLILCGGVSAGKFDFIPQALKSLGCIEHFHQVKQRPGKPLWFGRKNEKVIFGLPGNPLSAMICMRRYVTPSILHHITGVLIEEHSLKVKIQQDINPAPNWTRYIPVSLRNNLKGEQTAITCSFSNSNDYASIAASTGFVEIPNSKEQLKAGSVVNYFPWDASLFCEVELA